MRTTVLGNVYFAASSKPLLELFCH